jgi:hypothetical protein
VANASVTSQVQGNSTVNLTALGGQDWWYTTSGGVLYRKSGGGSKINVAFAEYPATFPAIPSSPRVQDSWGGGFQNTSVNWSDGTPGNLSGQTTAGFISGNASNKGAKTTIDMAVGTQAVEINVGAYVDANGLQYQVHVTSPSAGVLLNQTLTGTSVNTDTDKKIILSCVCDTPETWTFDIYQKLQASSFGDGYFGIRYVHLGTASGGGGGGISIPVVMQHLRNQGVS